MSNIKQNTQEMNFAYILLGTNLGDKISALQQVINSIQNSGITIQQKSSIYLTSPWGNTNQPSFYNMVIRIETGLLAIQLLDVLLEIEKNMGRERTQKWGERIIDLDILFYNNDIIVLDNLKVPHPALHERMFTLVPLCEIAPNHKHPVFNLNCEKLLKNCTDKGTVSKV